MKACKRLGIDLTKRCNVMCKTCFYRWQPDFNTPYDKPFSDVMSEIMQAKSRGCDHVVAVGWGEPGLYRNLNRMVEYCASIGMSSSIITNGTLPIKKYEEMYEAGLDHLHISVHGFGKTLDDIVDRKGAGDRQIALLEWLKVEGKPFRTNTTLQRLNYEELPWIMDRLVDYGSFHSVLLGFLPHYQWADKDKMREVAVDPRRLRPQIEMAIETLLEAGVHCTLRYHPMCLLTRKYWPHVTNALYVLYDPYEWDYGHAGDSDEQLVRSAVAMAQSVAVKEPCGSCDAMIHCGGWNKHYAAAFDGAGLKAQKLDTDKKHVGYFFNQNPINSLDGCVKTEEYAEASC